MQTPGICLSRPFRRSRGIPAASASAAMAGPCAAVLQPAQLSAQAQRVTHGCDCDWWLRSWLQPLWRCTGFLPLHAAWHAVHHAALEGAHQRSAIPRRRRSGSTRWPAAGPWGTASTRTLRGRCGGCSSSTAAGALRAASGSQRPTATRWRSSWLCSTSTDRCAIGSQTSEQIAKSQGNTSEKVSLAKQENLIAGNPNHQCAMHVSCCQATFVNQLLASLAEPVTLQHGPFFTDSADSRNAGLRVPSQEFGCLSAVFLQQ